MRKIRILILGILTLLFAVLFISCKNYDKSPSDTDGEIFEVADIRDLSFEDFIAGMIAENDNEDAAEIREQWESFYNDELIPNLKEYVKANKEEAGAVKEDGTTLMTDAEIDSAFTAENGVSAAIHVMEKNITYYTTSASGERIKASARVLINYCYKIWKFWSPTEKFYACSDAVVLHNHVTVTKGTQAPYYDNEFLGENGLMWMAAFKNRMVVNPDYEGYGISQDRVHPYLVQEPTARQCVDAVIAAIDWKQHGSIDDDDLRGLEDDFGMYNLGYSQGGSVTLAVHNYIEKNNLVDKLHFKGSLCGDGPYDPVATYKFFLSDGMYLPSVVPLILRAYLHYYGNSYLKGYKISDFLNDKVCAALKNGTDNEWDLIDCKTKTTGDIDDAILAALGKTTGPITAAEMFNPDALDINSKPAQALVKALEANNYAKSEMWEGGKPQKPVIAIHWQGDEVVPYVNYQNLQKNLANIHSGRWNAISETAVDVVIDAVQTAITEFQKLLGKKVEPIGKLTDIQKLIRATSPLKGAHTTGGMVFFAANVFLYGDYMDVRKM